ncbi:MAG: hypothetical protein NTV46_02480 [Verrucomicrobia bacterium]|nr:hypothetical protein [Verrucomicrobiota bacterium]
MADAARGKGLAAGVSSSRDMDKHAAATAKSGHALDFHSSSLLRNAATFLKWQIPMQAVMMSTRAFTSGFEGAMKIERQFATLRSVFNGTSEEAQKLKTGTLDLAAAEGRSGEEAMATSIRWSRLGFTRLLGNCFPGVGRWKSRCPDPGLYTQLRGTIPRLVFSAGWFSKVAERPWRVAMST